MRLNKKRMTALLAIGWTVWSLLLRKYIGGNPKCAQDKQELCDTSTKAWLERRKELLADPLNVRKVIIFAYMRGGSSIIGETFGNDDAAFYWYEPLDQFYNDYFGYKIYSIPLHITYTLDGQRRIPGEDETGRLVQFFDNIYFCRFDKIPRETLIHPYVGNSVKMRPLGKCIKNVNTCKALLPPTCAGPGRNLRDSKMAVKYGCSWQIDEFRDKINMTISQANYSQAVGDLDSEKFQKHEECMRNLTLHAKACVGKFLDTNVCKNQTMQVSKVLRANMETMEHVLQKMPDAYIVHYIRDPRAIAMSVNRVSAISYKAKQDKGVIMTELKMLCTKMKRDIEIRKELQVKFPGVFITLKYEDLVTNTQLAVKRVYSTIDRKIPPSLWSYLTSALQNPAAKEGSFSHVRRNATATSIAWREKFPKQSLVEARELCKEVLLEMDYQLDIAVN